MTKPMLCLATFALAFSTPAQAQPEPQTTPEVGGAIEDIVVTARKREESLQDTPIAISAYTGEGLETRGAQTLQSLATLTPNLVIQNNPAFGGSGNSAAVYIRGIGQQDFVPTVDPGVGIYVDGVYIARSVGALLDLVDFERVEVLRGPQGTLFGRNTIGGAISITTRKPDDELAANLAVTYGSDERVDAKATVNVPLSTTLFARLSAGSFIRSGYVERTDGVDLGDSNRYTGRLVLRWEPDPALTVDLAAEGTHARENGPALTLIGINYATTTDPGTPPFADISNVLANLAAGGGAIPCAIPPAPLNLPVSGCYDDRYVLGRKRNAGTAPAFSDSDLWAVSLDVRYELTDSLTLRSITAYRDLTTSFARDGDHSPILVSEFRDELDQRQVTQEVQLLGTSFGERLDWILGAFYFDERGRNVNLLRFTSSDFQSGGDYGNRSYAGFAQGTFALTDKLGVTAGVRYTRDEKSFPPDQFITANRLGFLPPFDAPIFQPGVRILPQVKAERTFEEFTPSANLSYAWTDDLLTYASYSRGFKSGGFSQRVFPPIIPGVTTPITNPVDVIPAFDPETVNAYELGFKLTAFDGRVTLNGAGYRTDYQDLQIQVFTSVAPVFENAASATITGFELELQARPGAGFVVEGAVGLTDAGYDEIDQATTFVARDNEFERVSKWTASAAVARAFETGMGTITPRVDWAYRSRFFNNTFNTPRIAQPGYHVVDASVTLTTADERFGLTGGVKNIGDEDYLISGVLGDAFQSFEGLYNRGREWYLTLRAGF